MTKLNEHAILMKLISNVWYICCNGQTEPDGENCALCGDTDHQAFECRINPFIMWLKENR